MAKRKQRIHFLQAEVNQNPNAASYTISATTMRAVLAQLDERDQLREEVFKHRRRASVLKLELDRVKKLRKYKYAEESSLSPLIRGVLEDLLSERLKQLSRRGVQRVTDMDWLVYAAEEMGEVAQAIQRGNGEGKPTDAENKYEEWIHLACVSIQAAEQVKEEDGHDEADAGREENEA